MAITDLTGYTWNANNDLYLDEPGGGTVFSINFTNGSTNYSTFYFSGDEYVVDYGSTTVYNTDSGNGWVNQTYRVVTFNSGSAVTNTNLIAFLEKNGTLTPPAPAGYDVTFVTNGGSAVSTLEEVEELPTPLPTTTKANNIFVGWYYDITLTQRAYAGDELTANVTLYARWYTSITQLMTGIADAIRSKTSEVGEIEAIDFADKIRGIYQVLELTQAEYDALTTKNPNVYYLILEE